MSRIAFVCTDPGVPVFGRKGCSIHVQAVVRELVCRGDDVTLVAASLGGARPADLRSVEVIELGRPRSDTLAARERALRVADGRVAEVLDRAGPFDLVYERFALWATTGMRWAARAVVPSVLEVNALLVDEQLHHRGLVDVAGARECAAESLAAAGVAVCVSEPIRDWVASVAPATPALVLPNGVDPRRFPVTPEPPGPFTVGFVGTLKPWHGVDTLVRAVATLGDVHLRVVGDGPEGEGLRELAQRLGLADRVVFTGAVDPASLPAELARVHVAAAPYPEPDGYFSPLKVFEYLAAGRPVVASRSGQLREVLTHGHDALLVPPGDQGALVAALARLRDDPVERARLAQAARRTASRHTWTAVVARSLEAAGLSTEPEEVAS